jgi:hypothetical protein
MLLIPCTHNCAVSRYELKENGEDVKVRVRRGVVNVGTLDNADGPKREGDPPDVECKLLASVMCKVAARLVRLFELCFNVGIILLIIEYTPVVCNPLVSCAGCTRLCRGNLHCLFLVHVRRTDRDGDRVDSNVPWWHLESATSPLGTASRYRRGLTS